MTSSLVYIYAVLPRPIATDIKGINAQPVRWVVDDGLAAAVSDVPAEDFDEAPLNDNVRDMAWLGPRAVAHQDVNARLHEQGEAIVPLAPAGLARRPWLSALLPSRAALLRAPLLQHIILEDWLLENPPT